MNLNDKGKNGQNMRMGSCEWTFLNEICFVHKPIKDLMMALDEKLMDLQSC